MDIHLEPGGSAHEAARRAVVGGAENAPVRFWMGGRHVMSHKSLYRAAATTAVEEPRLHTARWHPHPKAVTHPRLMEVVAQEHSAMDAQRALRRDRTARLPGPVVG